mgnify:CR=1 FL=1
MAVDICYSLHPTDNKAFVWNIFGDGILKNVEENSHEKYYVLVTDSYGNIDVLGKRYRLQEIKIDEEDEYEIDF